MTLARELKDDLAFLWDRLLYMPYWGIAVWDSVILIYALGMGANKGWPSLYVFLSILFALLAVRNGFTSAFKDRPVRRSKEQDESR